MKKRRTSRRVLVFDARVLAVAVMGVALLQFLLFVAGCITGEYALEPMRLFARDARVQVAALFEPSPLRAAPAPAVARAVVPPPEPEPVQLVFAPAPLGTPPAAPAPPARTSPDSYVRLIREAALRNDVPAALVEAIVRVESDFDARAVSPKGARGLMQIMPATGRRFGVADPEHLFHPGPNLSAGTAYLAWLLDRYEGNLDLTLAAYNAGEGAVASYGGIPPYPETREYVRRVRKALARIGAAREI